MGDWCPGQTTIATGDWQHAAFNAVKGCNFWGGNGIITLCADYGMTLKKMGHLEEILMHEGAHVTLDARLLDSDRWHCARDLDKNFISSYARANPNR